MSDTVWGALFLVLVVGALPLMSMQAEDVNKPDFTPRTWKYSTVYVIAAVGLAIAWLTLH